MRTTVSRLLPLLLTMSMTTAWAQIVDVAAGSDESLFVSASGHVYETGVHTVPVRLWWLREIVSVSLGKWHAMALTSTGAVATWASSSTLGNRYGQLGVPRDTDEDRVDRVAFPEEVVIQAIAAGSEFSLALASTGHVYAWGNNEYGQLGDESTMQRYEPKQVVGIDDAVAIAAGQHHAIALLRDGTVVAWGRNQRGQLGNGDYAGFETRPAPISFDRRIGPSRRVSAIASHSLADHSIAILDQGGIVVTWGANRFAQLGDGTNSSTAWAQRVAGIDGAVTVAVGERNSYAIVQGGTIFGWSYNEFGQLGNGSLRHQPGPTQVAGRWSATRLAAGSDYVVAVLSDGRVIAWGRNDEGQLGSGDRQARPTPELVAGTWIY